MSLTITSTYADWLSSLFDHDEAKGDWRFGFSQDHIEFTPEQVVEDHIEFTPEQVVDYVTQMFTHYDRDLAHYSDWQLAMGVDYIFDNSCSDYAFDLRDRPVAAEKRIAAILSLKVFFEQCYDKRCVPSLGHYSEKGNALNGPCYMLWDTTPLSYCAYREARDAIYPAITEVMEFSLTLSNIACIESGLHGLGHMVPYYPEAAKIIDRNMHRFRKSDRRIMAYAKAAKTGYIL